MAAHWPRLAIALVILGLGVPFFALLPVKAKSSWRVAMIVAAVTLIAQAINTAWLILPGRVAQGAVQGWGDPFLCAGLLGVCAIRYRVLLLSEVRLS
ncbi:hypothetical protein [Dyella acidiphila]|uniref:Uncharacterized protein n=1 Tax=Dyella acidiphila TaxID=2775866 RepID=A0ABR9GCS0_9GAMM|nr:hypothetical protein [Dyella acidiphila]MBE1161836.1 hypothetical protein [Dyella acidiphila]